jgi:HTH-type transcriptional regulator / antitoxin MqsA
MDQLHPEENLIMSPCQICGSTEFSEELFDEIFQINGTPVLVEKIPARVCAHCGEVAFSRETTEKIRQMLHEKPQPLRSIQVDVYAFQAS